MPEKIPLSGGYVNSLPFPLDLPLFSEKAGILSQIEKGDLRGAGNLKAVLSEQNLFCSLAPPIKN